MCETDDETDTSRHITDEEIRVVLDHYEDPAHPDALTLTGVRSLLGELQRLLIDRWAVHMTAVENRRFHAVRYADGVVVLADGERRAWNRLLDRLDVDDQVARTVLRVTHHQAGDRLTDHEFDGEDAIVVDLSDHGDAGVRFVEATINSLLVAGLASSEAWAYYGTEIRGDIPSEWADRCGLSNSMAVVDAAEAARDVLGQ